jgi:MFS family permease
VPPSAASERSPLVALFLTVFIDLMGFGIVIPLLPIYAERLHATPAAAGALIAVYSLMQLVFAPVWGAVSDRLGRRPVLLVCLSGSALSYLLLAAAWSAGAAALPTLFAARILAGVAGASIPVAQAYIADVTTQAERARGMGLIGAAFGLGMVVGPAIGGGLSLLGLRVPEFAAAALCLANVVLAARRLPESLPAAARRPSRFRHPLSRAAFLEVATRPGAAALLGVFFLVTLGFAVLEGTFSLAASHLFGYTPAGIDGLWLYMGLVAVVVQGWLVGQLAGRLSERLLVIAGAALLAVGLGWVPNARGTATLLAATGLVVAGQGLAGPSLSSLISKTTGAAGHGQVLGVSQSLSAGARVLGPAGGGFVFHLMGAEAPYLAAAACAFGALALAVPAVRPASPEEPEVVGLRRG